MRISDWSSDVCSSDLMADRPFGHADEAALVVAAFDAGVKAPEVVGVLEAGDGLGTGYVMRRVMGEVSPAAILDAPPRSEEHTSELQSLMRISYAVFCLKKKKKYKVSRQQHQNQTC